MSLSIRNVFRNLLINTYVWLLVQLFQINVFDQVGEPKNYFIAKVRFDFNIKYSLAYKTQ